MEGNVWVNSKEARVEGISGHLIHEVKFGGGLLGNLNKGGTFDVKRAEVAPGYWELTLLKVQMKGKALFFKTIGVQQNYSRNDFRQVPNDLTMAQAADILRHSNAAARPTATPVREVGMRAHKPLIIFWARCQARCRCTVGASGQTKVPFGRSSAQPFYAPLRCRTSVKVSSKLRRLSKSLTMNAARVAPGPTCTVQAPSRRRSKRSSSVRSSPAANRKSGCV
jgi:hypothetical protein